VLCDAVGEVLATKYNITVRKHGGRYNANAVTTRLLQMLGDKDAKPTPPSSLALKPVSPNEQQSQGTLCVENCRTCLTIIQ